jgi:hypothetical protein
MGGGDSHDPTDDGEIELAARVVARPLRAGDLVLTRPVDLLARLGLRETRAQVAEHLGLTTAELHERVADATEAIAEGDGRVGDARTLLAALVDDVADFERRYPSLLETVPPDPPADTPGEARLQGAVGGDPRLDATSLGVLRIRHGERAWAELLARLLEG